MKVTDTTQCDVCKKPCQFYNSRTVENTTVSDRAKHTRDQRNVEGDIEWRVTITLCAECDASIELNRHDIREFFIRALHSGLKAKQPFRTHRTDGQIDL